MAHGVGRLQAEDDLYELQRFDGRRAELLAARLEQRGALGKFADGLARLSQLSFELRVVLHIDALDVVRGIRASTRAVLGCTVCELLYLVAVELVNATGINPGVQLVTFHTAYGRDAPTESLGDSSSRQHGNTLPRHACLGCQPCHRAYPIATRSANMTGMPTLGKINVPESIKLLFAELKTMAEGEGIALPTAASALEVAQAYRAAKDPFWGRNELPEPSDDKGVALACALGLLASSEVMRPFLEAMRRSRRAAADAADSLGRLVQANYDLQQCGQRHTPLFDVQTTSVALLEALKGALAMIPDSFSGLEDGRQEEVLLMNATRELASAFGPAEVSRLLDDCKRGTSRQRRLRVAERIRRLPAWAGGYSELWHIPEGWKPSRDH
jgi:hypothetical protein